MLHIERDSAHICTDMGRRFPLQVDVAFASTVSSRNKAAKIVSLGKGGLQAPFMMVTKTMHCRVFLVEDSALMRSAIIALVGNECELVGWVDNAHDALHTARKVRPDVILLDISLPGISGLAVLPQLRSSLPQTAVVVLTNHDSAEYFEEAFRRGASGYVLKSNAQANLLPTIRRAAIDM